MFNILLYFQQQDYQELIKETNQAFTDAKEQSLPEPALPPPDVLDQYVDRLRDCIEDLPDANRNTLQYIISHLTRFVIDYMLNNWILNHLYRII